MVLMIGLHSLLEYPLWYAYFLLPAAWAWGFALGRPRRQRRPRARRRLAGAGGGVALVAAPRWRSPTTPAWPSSSAPAPACRRWSSASPAASAACSSATTPTMRP